MPNRDIDSRSVIAELIRDSKLYTQSKSYIELLEFVGRLRNFAPFNAMLLQIQKPGLSYAASARDWCNRFKRKPKEGARPLLILRPFGPVDLVYDVMDTVGEDLPQDVECFPATGVISDSHLMAFKVKLKRKRIEQCEVDAGDKRAGSIREIKPASNNNEKKAYRIHINRNHPPPTQFASLVHELGHLLLGHLGEDPTLKVKPRPFLPDRQRELEAESVSYVVCKRNGVESKSESYISSFVGPHTTLDDIDIYLVLRAVGEVEKLLDLTPGS